MKRNNYILLILACFLTSIFIIFNTTDTLAQPANDMCASAVALTVNADLACGAVTNATIAAATDSGLDTPPEDNTICFGTEDDDVWFSFVATNAQHQIDLTNITGSTTDLYHSVWEGSCGALMNLSCSDPNSSTLTGLTPGNTYYVRVYSWTATAGQDSVFDVCIGTPPPPPPPPANDMCADAVALPVNADLACGTVTNTTIGGATDSGLDTPPEDNTTCFGTEDDDVWFTFVATNSQHQIDLTNITGSTTDLYHSVWEGSCGALTNIICSDPNTSTLTGLTPGVTYYVRIYSWTATIGQDSVFDVCIGTPPPPPPGDECADPIPYPGDVEAGTCVTGFDFTIFSDNGNPSPTCDFGGDAVVWFSWTAPVVTAAGDPLDLNFDDGDGQAMDCDIGVEFWMADCSSALSNCLGNVSGTVTGLVQGMDYLMLVYDDSPAEPACDFCLTIACSAPVATATAICQPGDESGFYVEVDVTNIGVGNTAYTVDVGGPQANITATGITTYGPFPSGTPVDVVLTGVDDATCGLNITGLDMMCICDPLSVEAVADGVVCPGDPFTLNATLNDVLPEEFIDYTVTPGAAGSCTAVADNPADCVDLALGDDAGSGPIPLGFSFDFFGVTYTDVCVGSNGYVTFTCVDETDLSEDPIPDPTDPNAIIALFWDDLNATDAISGIICTYPATIGGQTCFVADYQGIAHFGGGETVTGQIIICPDNTVTINCIDCQSDGGTDSAGQGIEDETGTTGYFDPAFPDGTVPAAATTANCVTFTPNVDPPSACDFVAWVTDLNDIAGTTVSTTTPFDVNPTMTTTYYAVVDCNGVPCVDDVVVTMDDPANCTVCQGIDLAAGLPVIPTEVCSGATADICLTLIDATEGLVVMGTIDGAPVTLTGVAGAGAEELCVTINAPANETCDVANVVILIESIQCADGTDYPGILGGATLLDDLTGAGLNPINVPVYPTLMVNTSGDGTCGMLTAELVATDGTVCATAAGSPFMCAADGDVLAFDFTGDPALANFTAVPVDCPLPALSGTLTCAMCAAPCDGLAADPGIVSPIELCDGDGPIDVCFLMVDATQGINFDVNIDGAPAGVIPGVPGANPNELCIQLPIVANQTCDLISFNITFNAITCDNGDAIAGPASPSLADDLNAGGGIVINVYPNLTVNTAGDGTCGMLTAELVAADNTVCAIATGSPYTCTADGDALAYDFAGDVSFTPPAACPLPTLSGTLTCGNCSGGATCTLMAPACNACPDPACETSTVIDLMTGMELNDSQGGGATPVFPDYDITTNMGTLTLPAGGDMIYAVSGATGLTLPNNISEVCLTMDINVISGEIPFLLEFRIENGVPGQQLQFNTMVDGLGMCSVGGNLADAVPAAGFTFVNGASYAVVAAIADFDGTPVAEDLVVEISNIMLTVCAPDPAISGCTDPAFDNYDPDASCDDGSCFNEPTCPMCGACETPNEIPFAEIGGGDPDFSFAGADASDDGTQMILNAGANGTFAGHGWFIDQSAIPAGADISDYCIFGDFNVIADPADLPFVIEFRIENNGIGTFIEFNTTVTTSGPITIGGNLSTGGLVGAFDINGAAPALVIAIAIPGLGGNAPPTQDVIVEYSNVYITDGTCNPATIGASTISTTDPTRICIDGVGDPINVAIDVDGGGTGVWVITDAAGIILALPAGPPFDLDGAGAGQCLIWYANVEDPAFMPMVGDDAAAAVAASSCAFLSDPITVDRIEVSTATISSPQSPISICVNDNMDEPVDVTIDDAGIGAMGAWVITDAAGIILALPAGPPFVLDGAGVGTCLIWWVNFDDPAFAPAVGDDAAAIVAAATCAVLSNSIEVVREECDVTCEDAITGNVNLDDPMCDLAGTMIEILDSNGAPVAGSPVMVDAATGDYSLAGPFACGAYTAQIVAGTAPVCYTQLGGTEGPFAFEVDGDGTADGANFGTTPQIPTLSQWGLITLALLMMCFGAIKMAYRKEKSLFYIK